MFVEVGVVDRITAKFVDGGKSESVSGSPVQDPFSGIVVEEFSFGIQQLQSIPLHRIVTGGNNDSSAGFLAGYGDLNRGSGRQTEIDDIQTETGEGADNQPGHQLAADAAITANDDLRRPALFANPGAIRCRKANDVQWGE